MHRIRLPYRSLLWLPLALLFVVPSKATPTITPTAAGFDGERLQRLSSALEAAVSEERMAGAVAHPGERFVYGYSTDILGAIVEVASGLPLDQFFAERIFAPLSMVDTHFYLPPEKADRLAVVYSRGDDATLTRAPNPGFMISQGHYIDGPRRSFSGGAGLLSTAHDYARFLQMLLNGGELDGQRILSPKTVALMTANHLNGIDYRPGQGISLAFRVVQDVGLFGEPSEIGDYAWGGAYHTTYWVSPHDNLVVVFMTQLIPAKGSDLHQKLRTLLYQAQVE